MRLFSNRRKLSNLKHTQKYHFQYLGVFVLTVTCFILLANVALYMYFEEHCRYVRVSAPASQKGDIQQTVVAVRQLLGALALIEIVVCTGGMIFLAKLTAHRIAGAFLKLRSAFDDVADGNLKCRLTFRASDNLGELEESFNRMMDRLESRATNADTGGTEP